MRVLISGGGIAGLTLAYWLHQYAIPVVVIEQAKTLRRDGYAIDFLGTGYEVAERMSLIDRLSSQQIPFDDVAYVNKAGKLIARLDAALLRTITDGKYMGLIHWILEEVLYEALAGTVEVWFGRSLTHVVSDPDAVVVTFTDGTTESFDLLIGADGVHSTTRFGLRTGRAVQPLSRLHHRLLSARRPLRHRPRLEDVSRAGTPGSRLLHAAGGRNPHVFHVPGCPEGACSTRTAAATLARGVCRDGLADPAVPL